MYKVELYGYGSGNLKLQVESRSEVQDLMLLAFNHGLNICVETIAAEGDAYAEQGD